MSAFTAINDLFGQAPPRRTLKGDKKAKTEPAQHIIEFPGGAIELSRLEDGSYWAHIIINRAHTTPGMKGLHAALGEVLDSRVDWAERRLENIPGLPDEANLTQIAVRIRPVLIRVEDTEIVAATAGDSHDQ